MNNDNVTIEALLDELVAPCQQQSLDHVLLLQDTSQYNYEHHRGRFSNDDPHIGVIGDNRSLGLYVHPTLGVDEATGLPFGIPDLEIYHLAPDRKLKEQRDYANQPITEKHSYRWIRSINDSVARMPEVALFTAIADREADMYELFTHDFAPRVRLVIRSSQNRKLASGKLLHAHLEQQDWQGAHELEIKGNKKRKDRTAILQVKWATVELVCPEAIKRRQPDCPPTKKIQIVEIKETGHPELADGEKPIHWYLYTDHEVNSVAEALQIVAWYVKRWWIEDFFRLTKSQGFELEQSQFSSGIALKRLIHIVFGVAVKVLSLRQGRTLREANSANLIFDKTELLLLKALLPHLQGRGRNQGNLNPANSMAWATWIIARLGGWTPRNVNVRPPGVITLIRGLKAFNQRLEGFKLARSMT